MYVLAFRAGGEMRGGGAWHPGMMLSSNRRRQRSELRPHPKEEAMSHALATVLHRGRKAASNIMAACRCSPDVPSLTILGSWMIFVSG